MPRYLLGLDIGSSSVKGSLIEGDTGQCIGSATSPSQGELPITALQSGWAEQPPELWWKHVGLVIQELKTRTSFTPEDIISIGIGYQMHGLVMIDSKGEVLRPAIIWCDSRAVEIGDRAFHDLGESWCVQNLLNSPGNFTASKLRWVKENEPRIFERIHKFMLPGDYIALKMTGEATTTFTGLSEGILWNFRTDQPANELLKYYDLPSSLLSRAVSSFSPHGELSRAAAAELGLHPGTPLSYRAGDQPNNAFALGALNPGEAAANAGTSGVIYGVGAKPTPDPRSRVNTFLHVNHSRQTPRYGTLLCINGTGICNSWIKKICGASFSYADLNQQAKNVVAGADGLVLFPYGNGAERSLENRQIDATISGIRFPTHTPAHLFRAAQEGIVYSLNYGLEIMREIGISIDTVRAGHANMFLSPLFQRLFSAVTKTTVSLYETDGAQGAARGAGIGCGFYRDSQEALRGLRATQTLDPDPSLIAVYEDLYGQWEEQLLRNLQGENK